MLVSGLERLITFSIGNKQKGLEKPADMRQMPFCGAGFRLGLNDIVFCLQRGTQQLVSLRTRSYAANPIALASFVIRSS